MNTRESRLAPTSLSVKTISRKSSLNADESQTPNYLRNVFLILTSTFLVLSVFAAPEGAIRDGDYLPIVLFFLSSCLGYFSLIYRYNKSQSIPQNTSVQNASEKVSKFNGYRLPLLADFSLAFYILWMTFSYLRIVIFHQGDIRFSTNAYWTFITPAMFYYLLRISRNILSSKISTILLLLFLLCGIVESSYSIYSYEVINPQLRESYRKDPEKMLREANLNLAKDSKERLLFEKRLLESSEPTGSFGLANTLAGFLAPAFILGLLVSISTFSPQIHGENKQKYNSFISRYSVSCLFILSTTSILITIVLTKSRSGFLSTFIGCLGLLACVRAAAYFTHRKNFQRNSRRIVALVFFLLLAVVAAFTFGGIDKEVFTEAGKSLGYRLDYWKASSQMIFDRPLFGVGPGEFQNVYAQYILPTASEFIADPHNFIFEIAALFGIPALCAFLIFILTIVTSMLRQYRSTDSDQNDTNTNSQITDARVERTSLIGIYSGLALLFLCSFFQETPVDLRFLTVALIVLTIITPFFLRFINTVHFPSAKVEIIVTTNLFLVLLLNSCFAGGVGYPVITVPLFLFAAICVNRYSDQVEIESTLHIRTFNSQVVSKAVALLLALLVIFYATAFKPRCNSFLFGLQHIANNFSISPYQDLLKNGSPDKIDGASISVVEQFYFFSGLEYSSTPSEATKQRWMELKLRTKRVSPNSSAVRETCGDFDWMIYSQNKMSNREFLHSALEFYQEAVILSPTDVRKRTKLFHAYKEENLSDQALNEALTSLELDKNTPHEDRKLQDEVRNEMREFVKKVKQEKKRS